MNINQTKLSCGDTLEEKTLFIDKATFDINALSDILIGVSFDFSGRSFVFKEIETREECGLSYIKTHGYILVDIDHYSSSGDCFYRSNLQQFIDEGFIAFFETKSTETFKAYDFAKDKRHIECRIECGARLSFVKDFIDSLIAYKIENNVDNLTPSQIEDIKLDFFAARYDEIEDNFIYVNHLENKQLKEIEANYLKEKQKVNAKKQATRSHYHSVLSKYKL